MYSKRPQGAPGSPSGRMRSAASRRSGRKTSRTSNFCTSANRYSAIKEIGIQASKDLGFTIEIQVVDANTQLNRLFTQPKTIDINDMESFDMIRLQGKKVLAPIPTAKYKLYDKIVPIFTKGEYPDGRKVSTQGVSPFSVQYLGRQGRHQARQAGHRLDDRHPDGLQRRHARHPPGPDRPQGHRVEGTAQPRVQG